MSDPSNFVSFADYLGLNAEDAQTMLDKQMAGGDQMLSDAEGWNEKHYGAARAEGEGMGGGVYASTGEAARKGLASYSDFMKGMNDPEARQSLMEKTYGKGAVSALDSALVGAQGGGRIAEGQRQAQSAKTRFDDRNMAADARKGRYEQQTAAQTEEDARYKQAQQDAADAREKDRLGKAYWLQKNTVPDSVRHSQNWTQLDKEKYLTEMYGGSKYQDKATGRYNYDAIDRDWQMARRKSYENRPKTFWGGEIDLGFGPKPQDPSQDTDTWANYYAKNKRAGAK